GSWEPVQCHTGTGHCWCVDEKGGFIPASLTARSLQIPQCQTTCEKSRTSGLLSSWKQARSQENPSPKDLFVPACLETGEYARLQASDAGTWCVDPASGEELLPGSNSSAQSCRAEDGGFSLVQCDQAQGSCWCVMDSGEEVPGTRVAGSQPACESPRCPLPFNVSEVVGGTILCETTSGPIGAAIQQCQLLCRQGSRSVFPPGPLICSLESGRWESQPPQPRACQ
ncbi:TG isoform 17, partial [Pongo abelii]